MAGVRFEQVTKRYGGSGAVPAVDALDLDIADGEFMVLVGPSGCGKSTALRMIAGLEEITDGKLSIGDNVVNDVPPADRDIAMVFQNYALYPHMTVRENMGFALEVAGVKKEVARRQVEEAAAILGLVEYLDRLPKALSGGQRQRVAMGRAIVRSPKVFLMDEPLSNLDAKLRVQMRSEIIQLQARLGTTMVYVTHDQVEAMTMGHRVAVLRGGVLQQVAEPQELYQRPANLFVAAFIGSPAMNLVHATVVEGTGGSTAPSVELGGHRLALDERTLAAYPGVRDSVGGRVIVGIRPEHFEVAEDSDPDDRRMTITALLAESMGAEAHVHFAVAAEPAGLDPREVGEEEGDETPETIALAASGTEMIARIDGMHVVRAGDDVELAVKTERLHLFDPATGTPLR